jgi:predicted nucleic acid-binding protein
MVVTAVLDSNAVDPLLDSPDLNQRVVAAVGAENLRLLYTHVTVDEIAKVGDPVRRADLLALLTAFAHPVPTSDFVVGVSRLDMARVSGEDSQIDAVRSPHGKHTNDALIACTARYESAYLVTYENRLTNRAQAVGVKVKKWDDLLDLIAPRAPGDTPLG